MIDHIGFPVGDISRTKAFYQAALAPLGIGVEIEVTPEQTGGEAHIGFGAEGKAFFWVGTGEKLEGRLHVAFTAPSRAVVDEFYRAALAVGGADNGGPGIRAYYHPNYYSAFVIDLDGHNVEAVCHAPA